MSKTRNIRTKYFDYEDEFDYEDKITNTRNSFDKHKNKRMKSAMKNMDIDKLMELEDE